MTPADEAYAKHKAPTALASMARNLGRAHRHRYALDHLPGSGGGTAVVVGAGPSLSRTGHMLAAWQRAGATIITVNTAARAVAKFCRPDVVVAREVVNVASHLDVGARLHVLDLAAASSVWDAARETGAEVRWFCAGGIQYFKAIQSLGVRPLYGGPAALTAAIELAREWGASRIILLGVDCAFQDDGVGYAEGSAWSGYRGEVDGAAVTLGGDGFAAMVEQSVTGGIKPPPQRQQVVRLPAWGDPSRSVPALVTWADQVRSLETFAKRHDGGVRLVDATGSGAHKAGWEAIATPGVPCGPGIPTLSLDQGATVNRDDARRCLDRIADEVRTMRAICATVPDPDGAPLSIPGILAGCDVVEACAAGRMLDVRAAGLGPKQAVRETYRVLGQAADEIEAAVKDGVLALEEA